MLVSKRHTLNSITRQRYGSETVKLTWKIEKLDWKYQKTLLTIEFLTNCKSNNVIPQFLEFKSSNRNLCKTLSYL